MDYSQSIFNLIKKRTSWRTYSSKEISEDILLKINSFKETSRIGPFNNKATFKIISIKKEDLKEPGKIGTYGVIKGAKYFLAGVSKKNSYSLIDFAYCFQKIILFAADLGLSTCWLGGTFNKSNISRRFKIADNETISAISPLGYPSKQRNLTDKTMRYFIGANKRKKWDEIFFRDNFNKKLKKDTQFSRILEMVRIAPSASNKQPWRIISNTDGSFHFYLKKSKITKLYGKYTDLQKMDIGIAICHFDLCAKEIGLRGSWIIKEPENIENENNEYIASWV